jgi:hypothetical protein
MARKPATKTTSKDVLVNVKALKIAKAPKLGPVKNLVFTKQPAAPMSAAQATRMKNIHAQVRAFFGK